MIIAIIVPDLNGFGDNVVQLRHLETRVMSKQKKKNENSERFNLH